MKKERIQEEIIFDEVDVEDIMLLEETVTPSILSLTKFPRLSGLVAVDPVPTSGLVALDPIPTSGLVALDPIPTDILSK